MVKLYESGKPKKDVMVEYDLTITITTFNIWIKRSQTTDLLKKKIIVLQKKMN
ncbi:hypothetical protein KQI42_17755 [Tissierella sp. MSJ-40]|uniref:Helix-turn-helix domain-containing protein n=1 Tax=Tissierella simiarum TaxID=2841534 RepID=A0ABS6EAS2_9FIRM|nr:hypothetical protein [Tissierella simiarum]MBU5439864.1 hypothetical protein [Tissierella simiarum]